MKRYIYHYSTLSNDANTACRIDGIADMQNEIVNMDDYHKLKEEIRKEQDLQYDNITIVSLSLLKIQKFWFWQHFIKWIMEKKNGLC